MSDVIAASVRYADSEYRLTIHMDSRGPRTVALDDAQAPAVLRERVGWISKLFELGMELTTLEALAASSPGYGFLVERIAEFVASHEARESAEEPA